MQAINLKTVEEAKDYIEQQEHTGMVLFMHQEQVVELSKVAGDNVILCSSAGEFSKNGFSEHSIVGFLFEPKEADIVEIRTPAIRSLQQLQKGYEKVKNNPNAFLFLLCNGLSMGEESILSTLFFMKEDFKVVGGSAGDYCTFEDTKIYIGKKKVDSVGIYFNSKKRTQLIKENIYHSMGTKLLVTKADLMKRTVYELNCNKAATEYAKALGIAEEQLSDEFINHPIGKITKEGTFIASPMKVNPDKSITFYSQILLDAFVEVLEASNVEEKFQSTVEKMEFRPGFLLSVNCILRSIKFQKEHIWNTFNRYFLPLTDNQVGFISYGEQYYKRHLNQTLTLLIVEQ